MPLAIYILNLCLIKLSKTNIKLKVVPWEIFILKRKYFPPNDMKRTNYKNILLATRGHVKDASFGVYLCAMKLLNLFADMWNGNDNAYI